MQKRIGIISVIIMLNLTTQVQAESFNELAELSLDELLNVQVDLSKRSAKAFDLPSANYVISQEDIRRSGATSIPEILRMVPGLHVGQLSSNSWAINSRGTNKLYAHEMLVMIDGRTVFNQLFNGTYWSRISTMLADIEKIEVIRGPGGSLWGSNAAQGIINIITKKTSDTTGAYVSATTSIEQLDHQVEARYGFQTDNIGGRLYASRKRLEPSQYPAGDEQSVANIAQHGETANDSHEFNQTGFRTDWQVSPKDMATFQGDVYEGVEDYTKIVLGSPVDDAYRVKGGNILGRYDHQFSDTSTSTLQVYYDYNSHRSSTYEIERSTVDIDFQHSFSLPHQNIIFGAGYRNSDDESTTDNSRFGFGLNPDERDDTLLSGFIQDEISLIPETLFLTVGSKFENNDYTGDEFQPSVQLAYHQSKNQMFWASGSRSIMVPSRATDDAYLDINDFSMMCSMFGGVMDPTLGCIIDISEEGADANVIYSAEVGHRITLTDSIMIDHSVFWDDHHNENTESQKLAYVYGYEAVVKYLHDKGQLEFGYTFHKAGDEESVDDFSLSIPTHSINARSYYNLTEQLELDVLFYYTDQTRKSSSVSRLDLRLGYHPTDNIEISLVGTNLLDPEHIEGQSDTTRANTEIIRDVLLKATWTY